MKPAALGYLYYASLGYLVYYLVEREYWTPVSIVDPALLLASFALLIAGFACLAAVWQSALRHTLAHVAYRQAFVSLFLFNAGKYVPGKVVYILGVTAYLAKQTKMPAMRFVQDFIAYTTLYSLAGVVFGALALRFIGPELRLPLAAGFVLSMLAVAVLAYKNNSGIVRRSSLWRSLTAYAGCVKWLALLWVLWGSGFALLTVSLGTPFDAGCIFAYAVALAVGSMAFFAPSGLGVSESILAAYLCANGTSVADAAAIAVVARLWFMAGEMATLAAATLVKYLNGESRLSAPADR